MIINVKLLRYLLKQKYAKRNVEMPCAIAVLSNSWILFEVNNFTLIKTAFDTVIQYMWPLKFALFLKLKFWLLCYSVLTEFNKTIIKLYSLSQSQRKALKLYKPILNGVSEKPKEKLAWSLILHCWLYYSCYCWN